VAVQKELSGEIALQTEPIGRATIEPVHALSDQVSSKDRTPAFPVAPFAENMLQIVRDSLARGFLDLLVGESKVETDATRSRARTATAFGQRQKRIAPALYRDERPLRSRESGRSNSVHAVRLRRLGGETPEVYSGSLPGG
jgi:hypothetical protein